MPRGRIESEAPVILQQLAHLTQPPDSSKCIPPISEARFRPSRSIAHGTAGRIATNNRLSLGTSPLPHPTRTALFVGVDDFFPGSLATNVRANPAF